jgi:pimeloyl-ACP methyl ester carboxylesterase
MLHSVVTLRGLRESMWMGEDMTRLDVPTRFVWGDQDRLAPPSTGKELAERMSDGHVTVIPDAGHLPHLDQPECVAAVVRE